MADAAHPTGQTENREDGGDEDHNICSICKDKLVDPQKADCNHVFCKECISTWIESQEERIQCPVCRRDLGSSLD